MEKSMILPGVCQQQKVSVLGMYSWALQSLMSLETAILKVIFALVTLKTLVIKASPLPYPLRMV